MKIAGLLPGTDIHHLDHLAPLCSLLEIPLIVTDEEILDLANSYYPELTLLRMSPLEMPSIVLDYFDSAITCLPRALIDELFFAAHSLSKKRLRTLWCPHGNSDKGWTIPFMEALQEEEKLLIYGNRMRSFLEKKGVKVPTHTIGNYRLEYFERHRAFYDAMLPFTPAPTILYAPTWQDQENSCSFEQIAPYLFNLPDNLHIIVKPHPHLHRQMPELIETFKKHPRIEVLDNFPPIYPLLSRVDLYIGDMSSIGYDFLAFKRPMLFLNPNRRDPQSDQGLYLTQCGPLLAPEEYPQLYSHITSLLQSTHWEEKQQRLYLETFDPCKVALHDCH